MKVHWFLLALPLGAAPLALALQDPAPTESPAPESSSSDEHTCSTSDEACVACLVEAYESELDLLESSQEATPVEAADLEDLEALGDIDGELRGAIEVLERVEPLAPADPSTAGFLQSAEPEVISERALAELRRELEAARASQEMESARAYERIGQDFSSAQEERSRRYEQELERIQAELEAHSAQYSAREEELAQSYELDREQQSEAYERAREELEERIEAEQEAYEAALESYEESYEDLQEQIEEGYAQWLEAYEGDLANLDESSAWVFAFSGEDDDDCKNDSGTHCRQPSSCTDECSGCGSGNSCSGCGGGADAACGSDKRVGLGGRAGAESRLALQGLADPDGRAQLALQELLAVRRQGAAPVVRREEIQRTVREALRSAQRAAVVGQVAPRAQDTDRCKKSPAGAAQGFRVDPPPTPGAPICPVLPGGACPSTAPAPGSTPGSVVYFPQTGGTGAQGTLVWSPSVTARVEGVEPSWAPVQFENFDAPLVAPNQHVAGVLFGDSAPVPLVPGAHARASDSRGHTRVAPGASELAELADLLRDMRREMQDLSRSLEALHSEVRNLSGESLR